MKRRKRKRSSKAANPPTPKISSDVENSASDSAVLARADEQTHPGDEFIAPVEEKKATGPSAALAGADRRTHPRNEFVAAVAVVPAESGGRVERRVGDLCKQASYVAT